MHELFDIVERYGFIGVQDAEKVYGLPAAKLEKLHRAVFDHIYKIQNERIWGRKIPPPSAFSFHAGASIRGAWGCKELSCRLQKLDFLARYSALYANELTLPLAVPNPKAGYDNNEICYCLELDLVCLLFLRPLITAGVAVEPLNFPYSAFACWSVTVPTSSLIERTYPKRHPSWSFRKSPQVLGKRAKDFTLKGGCKSWDEVSERADHIMRVCEAAEPPASGWKR
jgi:hypothetical protein